jgi:hypothetical protein
MTRLSCSNQSLNYPARNDKRKSWKKERKYLARIIEITEEEQRNGNKVEKQNILVKGTKLITEQQTKAKPKPKPQLLFSFFLNYRLSLSLLFRIIIGLF